MKALVNLAIDASNLRRGGGRTHLLEILRTANPNLYGFNKVFVWGHKSTTAIFESKNWLITLNPSLLNFGPIFRILWHRYLLPLEAKKHNCKILFTPGGLHFNKFFPFVTVSQNMLPFEEHELLRYGFSFMTLKLIVLRVLQSKSFKKANGTIFLTRYAKKSIQKKIGVLNSRTEIISHGINSKFLKKPNYQNAISEYTNVKPYKILYVSTIDLYKHQWMVVEAVAKLRKATCWPIELKLAGPAYRPALHRLRKTFKSMDKMNEWAKYLGEIEFSQLHKMYHAADLGLFASSCENMPNTLIEMMASGLPIASSNRGPMPEILGEAGVYFDPENPCDIADTLRRLIADPGLRLILAEKSYSKAQEYSWKTCSIKTFSLLAEIANSC